MLGLWGAASQGALNGLGVCQRICVGLGSAALIP
jgi:hypothetical protein